MFCSCSYDIALGVIPVGFDCSPGPARVHNLGRVPVGATGPAGGGCGGSVSHEIERFGTQKHRGLSHPGTRTVWLPQAWGPHGRARPVAVGLALDMGSEPSLSGALLGTCRDVWASMCSSHKPTSSTLAAQRGLGLGVGGPTAQARRRRETEAS